MEGGIGLSSGGPSLGLEVKFVLYFVIEEVSWKVKGEGKYGEQEPPNPYCCMAGRYFNDYRESRETEINLLVL